MISLKMRLKFLSKLYKTKKFKACFKLSEKNVRAIERLTNIGFVTIKTPINVKNTTKCDIIDINDR